MWSLFNGELLMKSFGHLFPFRLLRHLVSSYLLAWSDLDLFSGILLHLCFEVFGSVEKGHQVVYHFCNFLMSPVPFLVLIMADLACSMIAIVVDWQVVFDTS